MRRLWNAGPAARLAAAAFCVVLALSRTVAHAEDPQDKVLRAVGVDERLGSRVPLDLPFAEASGKKVRLGDYFHGGPVILTLNYYTCPMLCPLTFRSLAATMSNLKGLSLSKDYRVVTVSINPEEFPEIARAKANETHALVPGLARGDDRWPFLYGDADSIRRLTESVGYRYQKVGSDFAHPAVAVVLTPDGVISRYLYGIAIPPLDLKLALIEAAGGKIGASSAANVIVLYCFHYDPVGKKYALVAMNVMKLAGAITLVFLAGLFAALHWGKRGRKGPAGGKGA
ncbi:MAG: SCO family protein [Verrucomicrobiota bacterium]